MSNRIEDILGISERDLVLLKDEERAQFIYQSNQNMFFKNIKTNKLTSFGNFNIISIKELLGNTSLSNVNEKNVNDIKILYNIDIGELQGTMKTKDKCMVQVASNFNCLEVASNFTNPQKGTFIEDLKIDKTQGPAATFGPLSASLYRCHFCMSNYTGQTLTNQINLLSEFNKTLKLLCKSEIDVITIQNGKLIINNNQSKIIAQLFTQKSDSFVIVDELVNSIYIGIHENIPILYDRKEKKQIDQINYIDQVFSSTINYNINKFDTTYLLSKILLRAAYEGIYLAAIKNKTKNLYLTLIGGGSFNNDIKLIIESMKNAHNKYIKYSCLENVYLCLYDKKNTQIEQLIQNF
ncbi:MAG: hypothetical protein KIT69_13810 [Propionibacteriaceae bacterium]|nr:hypothetical protein [Propionibacteriaceae bacterium]